MNKLHLKITSIFFHCLVIEDLEHFELMFVLYDDDHPLMLDVFNEYKNVVL